jgi:hypothetical protein
VKRSRYHSPCRRASNMSLCDKKQAGCQKLTQKSREFLGTSDHISTHFNQRAYNFVSATAMPILEFVGRKDRNDRFSSESVAPTT